MASKPLLGTCPCLVGVMHPHPGGTLVPKATRLPLAFPPLLGFGPLGLHPSTLAGLLARGHRHDLASGLPPLALSSGPFISALLGPWAPGPKLGPSLDCDSLALSLPARAMLGSPAPVCASSLTPG